MTSAMAFLGPIGWQELIILGVIGLLIFGRRLPEVGRSLGRGIVEFKQGLSGVEQQVNEAGKTNEAASSAADSGAGDAEQARASVEGEDTRNGESAEAHPSSGAAS